MIYFKKEIKMRTIYVVLIDNIFASSGAARLEDIRKSNANMLDVNENDVVLSCKVNNVIHYLYGKGTLIDELQKDKKAIIWEEK